MCKYLQSSLPPSLPPSLSLDSPLDVLHYVTIEKYTAEEEDEISFPKGVTVDVLQKSLDGWWLIKYNGKAALAPATFLVKKETNGADGLVRTILIIHVHIILCVCVCVYVCVYSIANCSCTISVPHSILYLSV